MTGIKPFVHTAERAPCFVCGEEGLPCGACRVDYYCGKGHQRADWRRHRRGCGVLEVRDDACLGRRLVAAKDIPAGTVVVREDPVITLATLVQGGVDHKNHGTLVKIHCVGCFVEMDVLKASQCPRCGVPVCSPECGEKLDHRPECDALQRAKFKLPLAELPKLKEAWVSGMMALRFCCASKEQPLGSRLLRLQQALPPLASMAMGSGPYTPYIVSASMNHERDALRDMERFLKKTGLKNIKVDDLTRAFFAIQLNRIDLVHHRHNYGASVLCLGLSTVEHSCVPNARLYTEEGAALRTVLLTTRDVACGEAISRDYGRQDVWCYGGIPLENPLDGRIRRRMALVWEGFLCRCELCVDPTEKGLHLSAWCCETCTGEGKQSIVKVSDLPKSPGGEAEFLKTAMGTGMAEWQCDGCGKSDKFAIEFSSKQDEELEKLLQLDPLLALKKLDGFIEANLWPRGRLHDNHYLILQAKAAVAMLPDWIDEDSMDWMSRREAYCRDVLRALDVLRPGCTTHRWRLLVALFEILRKRIKWSYANGHESPKRRQQVVKPILRECLDLVNVMEKISLSPVEKRVYRIRVQEQSGHIFAEYFSKQHQKS